MKTQMPVNRSELVKVISDLENSNTFTNRASLWIAVENTDWAKNHKPKPVTRSIAMLRAEKWGLELKTPKGKRGRQKGVKFQGGTRRKRADKFASNSNYTDSFNSLENSIPSDLKDRMLPIIEKIKCGSLTAAVKAKCMDCCNYQTVEIRNCHITSCSLWAFRPYQGKMDAEIESEDTIPASEIEIPELIAS